MFFRYTKVVDMNGSNSKDKIATQSVAPRDVRDKILYKCLAPLDLFLCSKVDFGAFNYCPLII